MNTIFEKYGLPFDKATTVIQNLASGRLRNMLSLSCILELITFYVQDGNYDIDNELFCAAICSCASTDSRELVKACQLLKSLPPKVQLFIINVLSSRMKIDEPCSVILPGNPSSFIALMSPGLFPYPRAYTISMWVKVHNFNSMNNAVLFHFKSQQLEFEGSISSSESLDINVQIFHFKIIFISQEKGHPAINSTMKGSVSIPIRKFTLLSFKHSSLALKSRGTFIVDGVQALEQDIPYPSLGNLSAPTTWTFGSNLDARISSVTLYTEDVDCSVLKLLYDGGPFAASLQSCVTGSQSSYDTGHSKLGILLSKGAAVSSKYTPLFHVTALHCDAELPIPIFGTGEVSSDQIKMSFCPHININKTPVLKGECKLDIHQTWTNMWLSAGGVSLGLQLLWTYCEMLNEESLVLAGQLRTTSNTKDLYYCCVTSVIDLLSKMVGVSPEMRDTFVQIHGNHLVAVALRSVEQKKNVFDDRLINSVFHLIESLGADSRDGDGVAAALQGLVFDFGVWKVQLKSMICLLDKIVRFTTDNAVSLYQSIGVQRVLDVLRLHVLHVKSGVVLSTEESDDLKLCADYGHKLLSIAIDAALDAYHKNRAPLFVEAEMLVVCLDETTSNLLSERLLRSLTHLRFVCPVALRKVFSAMRFTETTALQLLTGSHYSTEVRQCVLTSLLWYYLSPDILKIPDQLYRIREHLVTSPVPAQQSSTTRNYTRTSVTSSPSTSRHAGAHGGSFYNVDPNRTVEILSQLKGLTKPMERIWGHISMVAQALDKALVDGAWRGDVPEHRTNVDDVMDIFSKDGPLGCIDVWLMLPLLATLCTHASLQSKQAALVALSIAIKSDETQIEALCVTHERTLVEKFLAISDPKIRNVFGESRDSEKALVCADLSYDILSAIISEKMKFHGISAWTLWLELQYSLCERYGDDIDQSTGQKMHSLVLKRIVALVLQKLNKGMDGWNVELLHCLGQLVLLIEERRLCDNIPEFEDSSASDILLIDTSMEQRRELGPHERLIFVFLLDVMACLRKAGVNGVLGGSENVAIHSGLRVLVGCLRRVDVATGERAASELLASVSYLCEPWAFSGGPAAFKDLILRIFGRLRRAVKDSNMPSMLRFRLEATAFLLVNFFVQLRYDALTKGETSLAPHVGSALTAVIAAEGITDMDAVFATLEIAMRAEELISFEDEDNDMVNVTLARAATSTFSTSSASAMPDFLTPFPDVGGPDKVRPEETFRASLLSGGVSPVPQMTINLARSDLDPFSELSLPLPAAAAPLSTDGTAITVTVPRSTAGQSIASSQQHDLYLKWLSVRRGILQERIDSERGRLSRGMDSLDMSAEASRRHWDRVQSKVLSEIFLQSRPCEWKLGVAHEGPFPSRRRLVLRPRQPKEAEDPHLDVGVDKSAVLDSEVLQKELARAYVGYIKDVRRLEENASEIVDQGNVSVNADRTPPALPGQGWGMVDADGSEEGYGVVGVAAADANDSRSTSPTRQGDVTSDIRLVEEGLRQGRLVDTGPSHHGTRHINGGLVAQSAPVYLVTPSGNYYGTMAFNTREIYFTSDRGHENEGTDNAAVTLSVKRRIRRRRWVLAAISAVYLRRYRLRDSAIEVFFRRGNHRNFFVDFGHTKDDAKRRNAFVLALIKVTPKSAVLQWPGMSVGRIFSQLNLQEQWMNGEISNLDYLMALNTLAGRSFSDLTQYPVLPWVIAQYSKETIDLRDPGTYRDLSKPMGALNSHRLSEFMTRYASFGESNDVPAFMYGSHYSTMVGVVLHFLVRLQPFGALHKDVQNGHFDVSDRLFSSIPRTWEHNTNMLSEVKELTPEWFLLPEFLKNVNNFDLGVMQDGNRVSDVELPPWAGSAEDFVRINREALESDFVSSHLHEWIDLIFGYKQRGPAAVEAHNVFYYLTYYGSVDREMITDEALRKATELQIAHFGQCPLQLFTSAHPCKRSQSNIPRPLRKCFDEVAQSLIDSLTDDEALAANAGCTLVPRLHSLAALSLSVHTGRIVCILGNGVIEVYRFGLRPDMAKATAGSQVRRSKSTAFTTKPARVSTDSALKKEIASDASTASAPLGSGDTAGKDVISFADDETPSAAATVDISSREPLVIAEKDTTHFDIVPRVPLAKLPALTKSASDQLLLSAQRYIHFSQSGALVLTAGRKDGCISVREIDTLSGLVKTAADFKAHHDRVICISSDVIPGGMTDVFATCDMSGVVLIWTIAIDKAANVRHISRRPQRVFRCPLHPPKCCDLSWNMGIVVSGGESRLAIHSIERNETIRMLDVWTTFVDRGSTASASADGSTVACDIVRLCLSNEGVFVANIITTDETKPKSLKAVVRSYLASYTIAGVLTGLVEMESEVSFLSCPGRGSVICSGDNDGSVRLFSVHKLAVLWFSQPHRVFVRSVTTNDIPFKQTGPSAGSQGSNESDPEASPILAIVIGPDVDHPAVMCVSSLCGALYIFPLLDFVKWERSRSVSALSQMVTVPMAVVKGSLQQAQAWTSDAAGVLATNAKSISDEALKKINTSKLFKGVGQLLGMSNQVKDT